MIEAVSTLDFPSILYLSYLIRRGFFNSSESPAGTDGLFEIQTAIEMGMGAVGICLPILALR